MDRRYDNSPVAYTCPLIDDVIGVLEKSRCDFNDHEVYNAIKTLEEIRSATSELRDWGNRLYARVEELEDEIEKLEG